MRIPALITLLCLTALPAGAAQACPGLVVEDAWIRQPPPGATMAAGYARLRNAGAGPLQVDGARGDAFGSVALHRTVVEDGVSRMRHGEPLDLAPGAAAALEPGGWHLMLMRPARELRAGDRVELALTCGGAATPAVFTVRAGP
jgi:periplasmic copper chaperone A